jgi:hypothetical protein
MTALGNAGGTWVEPELLRRGPLSIAGNGVTKGSDARRTPRRSLRLATSETITTTAAVMAYLVMIQSMWNSKAVSEGSAGARLAGSYRKPGRRKERICCFPATK